MIRLLLEKVNSGEMMTNFKISLAVFLFFFFHIIFPQAPQVITIFPGFNEIANNNHPEISATFNVSMDSSSFNDIFFAVFAERSGYHSGNISYSEITKTISFNSNDQFNAGERVTVILSNKIKSQQGDSLKGFSWVFRIPAGVAPVNFGEAVTYGGGGAFMQCVDMNNDGYPDIVTSSGVILINNGNGVFDNYWLILDAIPDFPITVNDFNRDGYMDIYYSAIESPKIGFGDGAGNFIYSAKPYWFWNYSSADFNNDGWPDIAGTAGVIYIPHDSTTLNWGIAFNDGNGNFIDTTLFEVGNGGRPTFIITTDLENDGDYDVVIGSQPEVNPNGIFGLDGMIVGKNNGTGYFNSFQLYPSNSFLYISCAFWSFASDFNNDGFNDIAVMGCFAGIIALNSGNGTFGYDEADNRTFWFGDWLSSPIAGGDINGDDWIDIVVSGYEWPPEYQIPYYAVTINEDSYFPGYWNWEDFNDTLPSGYIEATDLVDLNLDGRLDIVHDDIWYGLYVTFNEDTITSVYENNNGVKDFYLSQNYPNPFNPVTKIKYSIPQTSFVVLKVYDLLGNEFAILVNEEKQSGIYEVEFNASKLSSGIYFYQLQAGDFISTKKLVLLK